MLAFLGYLILSVAMANPASSDLPLELRQRDQALLDAIALGDVRVWDVALAADAIYVDENGEAINRADFLKQLTPLPKGSSGTIAISSYSIRQTGDVVTVIHTDDENEVYHGQHLTAQYLTTETWQRQGDAWKLLLVHVFSVLKEPKSVVLPSTDLDAYVGRYTAATDLTYTIRRRGRHLIGERAGRPATPHKAEMPDLFFLSGPLRTRKIFERGSGGHLVRFFARREGSRLPS